MKEFKIKKFKNFIIIKMSKIALLKNVKANRTKSQTSCYDEDTPHYRKMMKNKTKSKNKFIWKIQLIEIKKNTKKWMERCDVK